MASQEGETAAPSDVADTDAPSFGQTQEGETDAPSQPDTTGLSGETARPADTAWLLVVALGCLLASVVVLTPARPKRR